MSKIRIILIRPVVSEKSLNRQSAGVYTFIVDLLSTKQEVKKEVEKMFNVKVSDIRTGKIFPKKRRARHAFTRTKRQKKAIVALSKGYSIDSLKIS